MNREEMLRAMKEMCNGLAIAEGREKADTTVLAGQDVTLQEWQKMNDKDKEYYAVVFEEYPKNFFFSGQKLTELINTFGESCENLIIRHEDKVRTKSNRDFTPITVVGYAE